MTPEFHILRRQAEAGDAVAQNGLGWLYLNGAPGIAKDEREAVKWMSKAAEQGQPNAQCTLGWWYFQGECGISVDYTAAMKWFKISAEQGFAESVNNMGEMYAKGAGVEKDLNKAKELFEKAALTGNASAEYHLGIMYYYGDECVWRDKKKAIHFLQRARNHADGRHEDILPEIDAILKNELHTRCELIALAIIFSVILLLTMEAFYRLKLPLPGKYYQAGMAYLEVDADHSFYLLKKAADGGNADAKLQLGICYADGIGTEANIELAKQYLLSAAEHGDASAQCRLGLMYYNGNGVEKNVQEAAMWFQKSADQGYAGGQNNLGVIYANGQGVKQDYFKAVKWYRMAAEQGNTLAQSNLGAMYENGAGVEKDLQEARKWYQKAVDNGYEAAKENLLTLSRKVADEKKR